MLQSSYNLFDTIWLSLREIVPVLSPILTAILTGILVWLYHRQSQILDRQKELIEAEGRALPRILTYRVFSQWDLLQFQEEEDISNIPWNTAAFIVYMKNPGKGYATDIVAELRIKTEVYEFSLSAPLTRNTNIDQMAFGKANGGVIAPEENELTTYISEFMFSKSDLPNDITDPNVKIDERFSPSELLWILDDEGEKQIKIGLFVHYKDETGIKDPIQLLTSKSELDGYEDIRDVLRRGKDFEEDLEPMFSHED